MMIVDIEYFKLETLKKDYDYYSTPEYKTFYDILTYEEREKEIFRRRNELLIQDRLLENITFLYYNRIFLELDEFIKDSDILYLD